MEGKWIDIGNQPGGSPKAGTPEQELLAWTLWTLDNLISFGFSKENIDDLKLRAWESNSNKLYQAILDVMANNAYLGIWAPEIMSVIRECECKNWFFNKTSFELYIQSKYTLLNKEEKFNFSENEFSDLLKYRGEKSIEEKSMFLKSILKALKGMIDESGKKVKLNKSDILYGIKNLSSYLLEKECKYQEAECKEIIPWQEAFLNLLLARRSSLDKWLKEETFDNRLYQADLDYRCSYFHRIDLDFGGVKDMQGVDDAVNILIKVVNGDEIKNFKMPECIKKLNPDCVFNYIILKKNWSNIVGSINTFINNKDMLVSDFPPFKDIKFLWNTEKTWSYIIRCLCKIARDEKSFLKDNHQDGLSSERVNTLKKRGEQHDEKHGGKGSLKDQLSALLKAKLDVSE